MRKTFVGYYRPTETEFNQLWDKCIFVLDANVLLNLYRYTEETRKKLIDILQRIKGRLWVPHQAALEYQRNRLEVISAQREAYTEIERLLLETQKKLDSQVRSYKRHTLINTSKLLEPIDKALAAQVETLKGTLQKHPNLVEKDDVREILTKLLAGKVGPPYSEEKLAQIYKDGEQRYAKSTPPGFKDAKSKDGQRAFGDLVLWYQVMDKAIADKVPIIIVTDDVKEDWWWRHEGKIIGPNPELIEEIWKKASVGFYMYVSDQFMEYAREHLKEQVDQGAIDEIREVRKLDEQSRIRFQTALHSEKFINNLRVQLVSSDAETIKTRAEIEAINNRLTEIRAQPHELGQEEQKLELVASLSMRVGELEGRYHALEIRRNELETRLRAAQDKRNVAVHRRPETFQMVRTGDGRFHAVPARVASGQTPARDGTPNVHPPKKPAPGQAANDEQE